MSDACMCYTHVHTHVSMRVHVYVCNPMVVTMLYDHTHELTHTYWSLPIVHIMIATQA
jgi:hypothetical protein